MFFDHGTRVLLVPLFGNALLERGADYAEYGLSGLRLLGQDAGYREMYDAGTRLRFYGSYEEPLESLGLSHIVDFCKKLEEDTAAGDGPLLLIGLFAEDPYERLASISIDFAKTNGRPPDRRELIEAYYGVPVSDLSLYIGYAQHSLFDVPLIATGREDLYATLNPSPALTAQQFREILYDHLVTRRTAEVEYDELSVEGRTALASYVDLYDGLSVGLGRVDPLTQTWIPLLPDDPLRT